MGAVFRERRLLQCEYPKVRRLFKTQNLEKIRYFTIYCDVKYEQLLLSASITAKFELDLVLTQENVFS